MDAKKMKATKKRSIPGLLGTSLGYACWMNTSWTCVCHPCAWAMPIFSASFPTLQGDTRPLSGDALHSLDLSSQALSVDLLVYLFSLRLLSQFMLSMTCFVWLCFMWFTILYNVRGSPLHASLPSCLQESHDVHVTTVAKPIYVTTIEHPRLLMVILG